MQQGMTRRTVLQAGAAAGLAALAADPFVKSALASMPAPGKLSDVEHVVVLIQENRSFDHYFGTLPGVRGFTDGAEKGILAQPGYPVEGYEGHLEPFHLDSTACFHDITHSWVPQHASWHEGAMDGFVEAHLAADGSSAGPATMGYYEKADIPVYHALAEMFTICDSYFCSVLGPTDPNRLYSLSGHDRPRRRQRGPADRDPDPAETRKIQRHVHVADDARGAVARRGSAGRSTTAMTAAAGASSTTSSPTSKTSRPTRNSRKKLSRRRIRTTSRPTSKTGSSRRCSWINASLARDRAPGELDGARRRIRRLAHHQRAVEPQGTVEEDGAVHHVGRERRVLRPRRPRRRRRKARPASTSRCRTSRGNSGGVKGPVGLGFRVPMLIVSPFTRGGFLSSDTFDHTSMLRFLETRFGVEVPNLSAWRRATTGDLTSAFNFAEVNPKRATLPKVMTTKEQREIGECKVAGSVKVPPNSTPEQGSREWRHPSGP